MTDFTPIAFGLASALSWGAGDFSGGLAAKRAPVYGVVIISQAVGCALLIGLTLLLGEPIPAGIDFVWGAVAGVGGGIGLVALYSALASGRMGVAAPVSAVVAALIPVVFAIFTDGPPSVLQLIGFGLALAAVWFISQTEHAPLRWRDLGLPLVAGVGFGAFFVAIGRTSGEAVLWPLVATRFASSTLLVIIALLSRQPMAPRRADLGLIALSGILDTGGNAFYALAARMGRLDVAAVLGSLYPASTVWLAWLILKERLSRAQMIGIGVALAAIVMIAL
jgi:drug/metabolite transporter (DMT)-like permease